MTRQRLQRARRPSTSGSQLGVVAGALSVALLITALPSVAHSTAASAGWGPTPPLAARLSERGVLRLLPPRPAMLRVRAGRAVFGSSPLEVVEAMAQCAREPLGEQCREDWFSHELPQRRLWLSTYWLDRTEVTVAQYARCVASAHCRPAPYVAGARRFARDTFPVSLVSWDDARAFCAWRGARLPTEAEFERAARGPSARRYPWGQRYHSRVLNHGRLGYSRTDATDGFGELAPVGSFPDGRSAEGFEDLAGNVSEWVADRYAPSHEGVAERDPSGPSQGTTRVVRGGDYESAAPWQRAAARREAEPEQRAPSLGFRCALGPGPRSGAAAR